jgi:purine-binding chemotaxis protein CheW
MDSREVDKETRIIVVEVKTKTLGFIVDSVSEVLRIPGDTVEPPPPFVADMDAEYINGVGKLDDRLLIMLDLEKLFGVQIKDYPQS